MRQADTKAAFGFTQRFLPGQYDVAEQAIAGMRAAGVSRLRTPLSAADRRVPGGDAWLDWLLPKLGGAFDLLPSLCERHRPVAECAEFTARLLSRHGRHFGWIELEERLLASGDGRQVVLAIAAECDAAWVDRLEHCHGPDRIAAFGLHGPSGTGDIRMCLEAARTRTGASAEIWLTETGVGSWRHDEAAQVSHLLALREAPVGRIYWSDWQDREATTGADPRLAHLGVTDRAGQPKLLRRLLEAGALRDGGRLAPLFRPAINPRSRPVLVLGGAGFIGSNLADSFLSDGREVIVLDNLSRPGTERNLAWLAERHGRRMHASIADLREPAALNDVVKGASAVFHLAAQVAVTSSLADPRHDFTVNAEGTLNALEAIRIHSPSTPIIFASTNKVYGALADIEVADRGGRMLPEDDLLRRFGLSESRMLDFCTPYGCSKGVADQYVLDYARSFGLRSAVLRMSCIYGPRQFGTEDQGWVAHFLIRALKREPITLFGDGRQVRDLLHVNDAVRAYRAVLAGIDDVRGRAFNLGGGPDNAVSLLRVLAEVEALLGDKPEIAYEAPRAGDQPYFVADTRRLQAAVGWRAGIGWREGVGELAAWLREDLGISGMAPRQRALA